MLIDCPYCIGGKMSLTHEGYKCINCSRYYSNEKITGQQRGGQLGGLTMVNRYGRQCMSEMGKKGMAALLSKSFEERSRINKTGGFAAKRKLGMAHYKKISALGVKARQENRKNGNASNGHKEGSQLSLQGMR